MDNKVKNIDTKKLHSERQILCKNRKCICNAVAGFFFISVAVVSYILDPVTVISQYCLKVENGSRLYNKLHDKLDSIKIKMYIFNITNYDRFRNGLDEKLKLEEVGPFTYNETRWNTNIELDNEQNLLKYTPYSNVTFVPEESIGDPKDIVVHVPNIIFLSFAALLSKEQFWVRTAFEVLTVSQGSKPVLRMTVHDYLWGYDEPLVDMASQLIPGVVFYNRLGLLSYGFHPKRSVRLELDTTEENKFQVKASNGYGGITRLGYQKESTYCNTFEDAYEGFIFPMKMSPKRRIRIYHNFFCRLIPLNYTTSVQLEDGTQALQYKISRDAYEKTPENQCLCTCGTCYRGLSDMSPCFDGLRMSLSHGHFLNADPKVYQRLEGIKPNEERHGSEFLIHKDVGLALKVRFSVQVSIMMENLSFSSAARVFSNMVIPYAWVQIEQQPLPDDIKLLLKAVGVYIPKIILTIEIIFGIVGAALVFRTCRTIQASVFSNNLHVDYTKSDYEKEVIAKELEKLNFNNQYYEKQDWNQI